jgi:predicted DNA-binding transcriptional regulator AlpA
LPTYKGVFKNRTLTEEKAMVEQRFYNIDEMSTILGKTISAIHGHLARKQYDAVPVPMKLGRRLAWLVTSVDEWIDAKAVQATRQAQEHKEFMQAPPRHRGRPTKAEAKARQRSLAS